MHKRKYIYIDFCPQAASTVRSRTIAPAEASEALSQMKKKYTYLMQPFTWDGMCHMIVCVCVCAREST